MPLLYIAVNTFDEWCRNSTSVKETAWWENRTQFKLKFCAATVYYSCWANRISITSYDTFERRANIRVIRWPAINAVNARLIACRLLGLWTADEKTNLDRSELPQSTCMHACYLLLAYIYASVRSQVLIGHNIFVQVAGATNREMSTESARCWPPKSSSTLTKNSRSKK